MSAISFPLTTDISSAASQVSSQNAEQLPAGGAGESTVLHPDTVTLSAVFPPPPPVDSANSVQFQVEDPGPAQPALQAFPPAPTQTTNSPAQRLPVANATTPATLTQQEQLTQLNRVLEQLGINPQSISLDNRLALIKSANDPPALLNLVRTLGVLNESAAASAQAGALNANNLSNPIPTGTQAQVPAPSESQAQPPAPLPGPPQGSSSPTVSGFETTLRANPGSLGQAASVSDAAAQFQELQSLCGNAQKSISTSLFDFHFCWSDATCAILQKIQAVKIGVLTQTLQALFRGTDAQNPTSSTTAPSLNIRA